ncbi:unnamed protein product [Orchesella dallaii]|uniref:Peroxin-19 n=1 Tax=Orchesella dallaii TaxID=48710 RepID=A0ABP1QSC5_9HEXA
MDTDENTVSAPAMNGNCNNGDVNASSSSSQVSAADDSSTSSVIRRKHHQEELPPTDDPELDALLDDALKDFDKPLPSSMKKPTGVIDNKTAELMMDSVWAEEFIKQATSQFEKKMRDYIKTNVKAGPKAQQQLEQNMSKIVDAASTAALNTASDPEALSSQLNEAIRNAAAKATEQPPSIPNVVGLPDENDFARMMSSLGMGIGPDNFDDTEMNEILPFMTNMMQKLLSKELLQPVLTDIVDKYPSWLSSNREKIPSKDFQKYSQQYEYMKQICEEYASENESDSSDLKKKRFERISDLMLKVQYAGPPPQELIGEVEGGNPFPTFDPSAGGGDQCSVM